MKYNVVLSDLSGTLMDDQEKIYQIVNQLVFELGKNHVLSKDEFKEKFTQNFKNFYAQFGINVKDAYGRYFPLYSKSKLKAKIIPGADEFLNEIKKYFKLGLVTGARDPHLENELKFVGIDKKLFDVVVGSVFKGAENTEGLEKAIEELDVKPENVVYLCDHHDDILMCHSAGVFPIAFNWNYSYSTPEKIEKTINGNGKIVSSYQEVLDFLRT